MKHFILYLAINHPRFYRRTNWIWNALDWANERGECLRGRHWYGRSGSCVRCGK